MADNGEALAVEAVLYAGGALEAPAAAAFEGRLADDQRAREALCRAVEFLHGGEAPRPDPAYRDRVARAVLPRPGPLAWLLRPRLYRGHPALWGGLGAAATALLMVVALGSRPTPVAPPESLVAAEDADDEETVATQAFIWADLPKSEHLARTHEEQSRHRARAETLLRLVKTDDGRPRHLAPAPKH